MPNDLSSMFNYKIISNTFNSSEIKVYINDFFLDDVVSLQYRIITNKTPIYSYASEFFVKIAPGTTLVDGVLAVVFTETAQFEIIRQYITEHFNNKKPLENGTQLNIDTKTGLPKDELIGAPIKNTLSRVIPRSYDDNRLYGYINRRSVPMQSDLGNIIESPVVRAMTIEDYLGFVNPLESNYENLAEQLEDYIWGSPNAVSMIGDHKTDKERGFAIWDPDVKRIRNDLEMDYDYIKTTDQFVRTVVSGHKNPFHLYFIYGDYNTSAAEHTIESIDDIHFADRQIAIDNDGRPAMAIYSFFGRSINGNLPHFLDKFQT